MLVGIPCLAAVAGDSVIPLGLAAAVLGVSYVRVRRLGHSLLPVAWCYVLASSIIATAAAIVVEELRYGSLLGSWVDLLDPPWFTPWLPFWPAMLAELLALLWFARRASRLGLAHAFFLVGFMFIPITHVVYTLFFNLDVSPLQPSHSSDVALMLVFLTFTVAAAVLGVVYLVRVALTLQLRRDALPPPHRLLQLIRPVLGAAQQVLITQVLRPLHAPQG